MKKLPTLALLLMSATLILAACQSPIQTNSDKLIIRTTASPLVEFTQRIGGDSVQVQSVFTNGSDSHTYDPTPQEMVDLNDADLFLNINVGDYKTITEKLQGAAPNVKFVDVSLDVKAIEATEHDHDSDHADASASDTETSDHEHEFDPHMWLDPVRSIAIAENIKQTLSEQLPDQAETFEANFQLLKSDLEVLDSEYATNLAPYEHDTFFVTHAAYGYLADRYNLDQIALSGLSGDSELSSAQLVEIADELKAHDTQYILAEENVNNKQADVLASELSINTLPIYNLETLTQTQVDNGDTYFTLMRENLKNLQQALKK